MKRERFILTLEARRDPCGWREPSYRLKQVLKLLLRSFGFRCVGLRFEDAQGGPAGAQEEKEKVD